MVTSVHHHGERRYGTDLDARSHGESSLEMVKQNGQFIIATHSLILLAFPGAAILDFDCAPPRWADYANLEHVQITHAFLNDPERFLRRL